MQKTALNIFIHPHRMHSGIVHICIGIIVADVRNPEYGVTLGRLGGGNLRRHDNESGRVGADP